MTSMEESDHHQSGAVIIGSNDDLLTEILIRLPATSILRFKFVCKHWRWLLSQKHFTRRYDINNNFSKSVGLFGQSIYVPFDVETRSPPPLNINNSLDFYFNRSDVRIIQSCNGLLLCSALNNDGDCEYYVFNPTTKQLAIIPSLPEDTVSVALAFHQTECVHYKVVCLLISDHDKKLYQIQVYSSDTRKWKIGVESFSTHIYWLSNTVYWNGAIHWAPDYLDSTFWYFELDTQKLQMWPVPEELVYGELSTMYFGESRGHLHFISKTKYEDGILNLNVYEMLMDRSGWFVKYRVHFDELSCPPEMFFYNFRVVDVVRGKEDETFFVLKTFMKLIRYNVHDNSFTLIYSQPNIKDDDNGFYVDPLHEFYTQTADCFRYIEMLSSF